MSKRALERMRDWISAATEAQGERSPELDRLWRKYMDELRLSEEGREIMVKRVIYKGTPLASAVIIVAAEAASVTVHADPSVGKKVYLDGLKEGLTKDQATELARRLVQATSIMDDLVIEDDGLGDLQDRLARIRETDAESRLQDEFDSLVHDIASRQGSDINNRGLDDQMEFLVDQLGSEKVSEVLDRFEKDLPEEDGNG
jgi:hypothetical protein